MELILMIGIAFFFGAVILSTVFQRNGQPSAPVFIVRAESTDRAAPGDSGIALLVLLAVIAIAVFAL